MKFARFSGLISLSFQLDPDHLEALFKELSPYFVKIDKVEANPIIDLDALMKVYKEYWMSHDLQLLRQHFQVALTSSLEAIEFSPVNVAKAKMPVIMLRPQKEGALEALYPRIFQEADSEAIYKTFPPGRFANTALFQKMQRWLRLHTVVKKGSSTRIALKPNV